VNTLSGACRGEGEGEVRRREKEAAWNSPVNADISWEVRPWQREVVAAGERETRGAFWTRWAALFWRGGGRGVFL